MNENDLLYCQRHSLAHVLAEAVLTLFPQTQIAIGPVIENGFYYDMELPRVLTPDDLPIIEEKMRAILKTKARFEKRVVSRQEALNFFHNQRFKIELIHDLDSNVEISLYQSGNFTDLCRGPHVDHMGQLDSHSFKLTHLAGAYWRGNEKNPMLTRIYAIAFSCQDELEEHLKRVEEAEKRDHRRIGKELDLFHLDEKNPGQVFWHPYGWALWRVLEDYIRDKLLLYGYKEVKTPSVMPQSLWERSGHWAKYRENMFVTESEKRLFALKPMNCPGHVEIFKHGLKSYRDLPLRLAEFGSCTRNEASGALHGCIRTRGFVQDDAHIFCTEDQIESEVKDFCDLLRSVYSDFGFQGEDILVRLALRPELRLGDEATWDRCETVLGRASEAAGFSWIAAPGEGAFYGPKLEFTLVDALGRKWQCGTIQLDYQLASAERLNAIYIGQDGAKYHPVILHRAIIGSFERFISILIEHFAGAFPAWLAPVQAIVISVSEKFHHYAQKVHHILQQSHFRVEKDLSHQTMGAKIRYAQMRKIPYIVVLGEREEKENTVSIRTRGFKQINNMKLEDFLQWLLIKMTNKEPM